MSLVSRLATCAHCQGQLIAPMALKCGHSPSCTKCTPKTCKCSVCDQICKKRNRIVNRSMNAALHIMVYDSLGNIQDEISDASKEEARGVLSCRVCRHLPTQPVLFECGHSLYCWKCWCDTKPRSCPSCQTIVKSSKVICNQSLDMLMRGCVPEDYAGRDCVNISTFDFDNRFENLCIRAASYPHLPETYLDTAAILLRKETEQTGKGQTSLVKECKCGLLCIPKQTRKGRFFFGCPLWAPGSVVRSDDTLPEERSHCNTFAWLSKKQIECTQN